MKIDKLVAFLTTPTFSKLDEVDKQLLVDQLAAMKNYAAILSNRIERF